MRIYSRSAFLALILSLVAMPSFADEPSPKAIAAPPATECGNGYCRFGNLQDHTKGGQAAYYFCVPNANSTAVHMENHAVLITGFNNNGIYDAPVSDLNKYYFGVYIDPNKPNDLHWVAVNDDHGSALSCYGFTDFGKRIVNPNPPQLQQTP